MDSINIKICGAAGEGIKSIGLLLSKTFMRAGFYTFDYTEYPSLIRGGHNTYQIHINTNPVYSQIKNIDILIALNRETIDLHQQELDDKSLIIYDPDKIKINSQEKLIGNYLPVSLIKLATKNNGLPIMANNVALGAVMFLTGIDLEILKKGVAEIFAKKGEAVIKQNHQAIQEGFDYAKEKFSDYKTNLSAGEEKPTNLSKKILLTGNEAIALGAISAGMKFYVAYPMTPATSILHYLATKAQDYQLVVKHAEDEISVINMALGAAFAGTRSMVATSGGGFCLMTEALSMAGMMELPLVLVEGMRSGPSSGMPTWHDQGDLEFVLHAGHGEFPRAVLAPGDIEECFYLTRQAFYLAEKYQLPVIILTDKYLAESAGNVKPPNNNWQNSRFSLINKSVKTYKRYLPTKDGISLRSIPGQKDAVYLSNSYEHDEAGFATEESKERNKMVEKRLRKFQTLSKEVENLKQPLFGKSKSKIGIISWGSNKGPILEALKLLNKEKIEVSFLHLNMLWPFPQKQLTEFITGKKMIIDIECNATAQLTRLIREQTGLEIENKLLKYDGRPFYPEEIVEKVKAIM